MAEIVGGMFQAFVSHGVNMEEHLTEAQQSAGRNGMRAYRMQGELEALYAADLRKGREVDELRGLLREAVALLEQSVPGAEVQGERAEWHQAMTGLVVRAGKAAQTDAQPTEAVNPTCTKGGHLTSSCEHAQPEQCKGSTCKCPPSEFGTTVCKTATDDGRGVLPTAPSSAG